LFRADDVVVPHFTRYRAPDGLESPDTGIERSLTSSGSAPGASALGSKTGSERG
jgi:hypothetical protein